MKFVKVSLIFVMFAWSLQSMAGEYCWNDKVRMLIVKNNTIFFTSEKSCHGWCKVNPAWDKESINRAYTQLLTAKVANKNITFHWDEHESGHPCQSTLPVDAKPTAIILN